MRTVQHHFTARRQGPRWTNWARVCRVALWFGLVVGVAWPAVTHGAEAGAVPETGTITTHAGFWEQRRGPAAQMPHRVKLEFVVAYYDPAWHLLWIENGREVSFLPVARVPLPVRSRQRVQLEGEVVPAEGLNAEMVRVTVLEASVPAEPVPADGRFLDLARRRWSPVLVRAYVSGQRELDPNHLALDMVVDDRSVRGSIWLDSGAPVPQLAGQLVNAVGVATVPSDGPVEDMELQLWIAHSADVRIAPGPRVSELFALPVSTPARLESMSSESWVRVTGRVETQPDGRKLIVRHDEGEMEVLTPLASSIEVGSEVELVGIPVKRTTRWTLRDVICRSVRAQPTTGGEEPGVGEGLPKLRLTEQALRMLPEEAARHYPVELRGVVSFSHPVFPVFYLSDASGSLCVNYENTGLPRPQSGDVILLHGRTAAGGFATMIQARGITINGRGTLAPARTVSLEHALTGVEDAQWIEMRGYLRLIEMRHGLAYLTVVAPGGEFIMRVPATAPPPITLGSVLRASGICASKPNARRQLISVDLLVPSMEYLKIDDAAPADPFSRPLRDIASLRRYRPEQALHRQVRVRGVVIHHVPGRTLLIQAEGEVLRVLSRESSPLQPGDVVDVVGVPGRLAARMVLREGVYRRQGHGPEPEALALTETIALDADLDGRLVRISGTLLDVSVRGSETQLLMQTGSTTTQVVFNDPRALERGGQWAPGSKVALTGVYHVRYDEYDNAEDFNVELRAAADLAVLATPSWWTAGRALTIAGIFFGLHLLGLAWAGTLRRRVRDQTNVIRTQLENEASLEARYKDIVENASDFIFTIDLNGCFTSFNPAGEKLTGFPRAVALRLTIFDLLDRREARLARRALARPQRREFVVGLQTRLRRRDGSMVWAETSARFIRQNGNVVGVLGVVRDISARKQVEEELKLARDAAEANTRAKSLFLANMSHEIRTPMNGVIGMSHLLLDTSLDDQQRDLADTIRASAESLLTVLNDILDFSKIEAGKLLFEHIDFPLSETVDDALELLGARAAAKDLELAAFLPPDLPSRLRGDPGRLRQVLLNLIGNAVKFTDRGHVVVRATREEETAEHLTLRFTITDTGVGIAPEAQKLLFQAFHQADNSMTRRFGGTGLGLVISKQIVELMHGQIGVDSTLGCGSTFWFTARFAKVMPAMVPVAAAEGPETATISGRRLLVVDDHPVIGDVVRHLLAPCGVEVVVAGDAAAALGQLRHAADAARPFDLILLDREMPDMDGPSIAREIHSDPRHLRLPIVLLGSLDRALKAETRTTTGIVAYLAKPIRASELVKVVRRHGNPEGREIESASIRVNGRSTIDAGEHEPAVGLGSLRVLVAEDNVVNQRLTRLQLQKLGLNADIAADGREVLEAVERARYDVILMDCQMPEVDGFEATRRLRATTRHAGLRIIAMTANAMTGDRERCLESGMDDYLSKPTRLEDLRAALLRCVDSGRRSST